MNTMYQQTETSPPILGSVINDGKNAPFADLYYDTFPEWYDVE
jgi:hypothetical protein